MKALYFVCELDSQVCLISVDAEPKSIVYYKYDVKTAEGKERILPGNDFSVLKMNAVFEISSNSSPGDLEVSGTCSANFKN